MTARASEAPDSQSYTQCLLALARIEVKLESLVGEKGRIANIETTLEHHGEIIEEHEQKIQRARGALGLLVLVGGLFEGWFHKVWK